MVEIRIIDAADQLFAAILDGQRVTMRLRYNVTTERWSFDLALDERWVLMGRRIVLGADLLEAFSFGIGAIFAADPSGQGREPGRHELHKGLVRLYHMTEVEAAAERAAAISVQATPLFIKRRSYPESEELNPPPVGFAYVTDGDGDYIVDNSGAFLIEAI